MRARPRPPASPSPPSILTSHLTPPPPPPPFLPASPCLSRHSIQSTACGKPDDFINILITGASGSLANTQCSVTFTNFPDPTPPALCAGAVFGRPCAVFRGGLVITIGGFARLTDNPDVQGILELLGLGALRSVGGLFIDIADGSRVAALDILPALQTVSGAGLQVLGARQVGAAPGLASLRTVDGQLFLVATQLPNLVDFGRLAGVSDSAILINNHNLTSLAGLGALKSVGGQLVLSLNARLASLSGLEALAEVGTDPSAHGFVGLSVANNTRLTSVAGLAGLRRVGGTLQVANNPALASLAGLEGVVEVGDAAGSGASAGVAHAGVAVTGNTVLRDVSALAGLGQCGAKGAAAASPSKRPSVKVEVFLETGVVTAAPEAAAPPQAEAAAAAAAAALPSMPNDFPAGRTPGAEAGGGGGGGGGSAVAPPPADARPTPPDAAKPGLAGGVPGLVSFAARRPGAEGQRQPPPAHHPPAVVASRAEAAAAAAGADALITGGGGSAAPLADAAEGRELSIQLQSRGGGLLSRLLPPAPWARQEEAGAGASTSAAAAAAPAPPPGPRRPRFPPLPPLPTPPPLAPPSDTPAPPPPPSGIDPLLLDAINARPDTKCTFTSWEAVCAFIASDGSIPADHAWRKDGTCVGYAKPAAPAVGRAVVGLSIG